MRLLLVLRWTLVGVALAAPQSRTENANADLIVSGWNLRTTVFDSPNVVQNVAGTNQLQNPFAGQFFASIPPSFASANYQVSWNAASLLFVLDSTLHAESLEGSVSPFGHINVIPEVDSILSLDSAFQYSLTTQGPVTAEATSGFSVSRTNPNQVLYNNSQARTNFLGPPSGTMVANADIFLPAGQTWRIQWSFGIDHFGTAIPGATSNGTGHLAFEIHPAVPEPATLSLLLLAAVTICRPRELPQRG